MPSITTRPEAVDSVMPGKFVIKGVASRVVLDFDLETAEKSYRHTWLDVLYWFAFQAPFPYASCRFALEAARELRTIAGLLTEYWFEWNAVAPVVEIVERNGGYSLISRLVRGQPPSDTKRAHDWLRDVADHFVEAGLPTWQIAYYNPRALSNVIETTDGRLIIVDLESTLVTPIVPLLALPSAIRSGRYPAFDGVDMRRLRWY